METPTDLDCELILQQLFGQENIPSSPSEDDERFLSNSSCQNYQDISSSRWACGVDNSFPSIGESMERMSLSSDGWTYNQEDPMMGGFETTNDHNMVLNNQMQIIQSPWLMNSTNGQEMGVPEETFLKPVTRNDISQNPFIASIGLSNDSSVNECKLEDPEFTNLLQVLQPPEAIPQEQTFPVPVTNSPPPSYQSFNSPYQSFSPYQGSDFSLDSIYIDNLNQSRNELEFYNTENVCHDEQKYNDVPISPAYISPQEGHDLSWGSNHMDLRQPKLEAIPLEELKELLEVASPSECSVKQRDTSFHLNRETAKKSPTADEIPKEIENKLLKKIHVPGTKRKRGPKSYEFLERLLQEPQLNPSWIRWEQAGSKIFRLMDPHAISRVWGRRSKRGQRVLSYDNFARNLRYHYKTGHLVNIADKQLVYAFGTNKKV